MGSPCGEDLANDTGAHWYAFYTRARHEQRVQVRVTQAGYESFVPRVPLHRQWKDRKKVVNWPLFPGYVFVWCASTDIAKILSIAGVVSVVSHSGRPAHVSGEELGNIRRLVTSLLATGNMPERVALETGLPVQVVDGPFRGIEGVVVERRNSRKFVIQLTTIGVGLMITVDDRLLVVREQGLPHTLQKGT